MEVYGSNVNIWKLQLVCSLTLFLIYLIFYFHFDEFTNVSLISIPNANNGFPFGMINQLTMQPTKSPINKVFVKNVKVQYHVHWLSTILTTLTILHYSHYPVVSSHSRETRFKPHLMNTSNDDLNFSNSNYPQNPHASLSQVLIIMYRICVFKYLTQL